MYVTVELVGESGKSNVQTPVARQAGMWINCIRVILRFLGTY